MGLLLIAISMMGWQPSRAIIFGITGVAAVAALTPGRRLRMAKAIDEDRAPKWWLIFCFVALAYGTFVVAVDTCVYPTGDWDAFAIWQLKSKVLTNEPLVPRPAYFTDVSRSFSHLEYPVLVPMISAGEHAMAGSLDDEKEKAPQLLFYLGLGAVVYAAIRRRHGGTAAVTATTLLLCTPKMLEFAGTGDADLPLAAFYACSLVSLLNWQQDRRRADLIFTALFTILLAWSKQEGLPLAIVNVLAVAALSVRKPATWISFGVVVAAAYLPWFLYTRAIPRTDENYMGHLHFSEAMGNLSRLGPVLWGFLTKALDVQLWSVFWYLLPIAAILRWRRFLDRGVMLVWILLTAHFLIYLPPYLIVANWDFRGLMNVTQDRLLLHITPAAALLIGLQWPRLRDAIKRPGPEIRRPQSVSDPR